MRTGVAAWVAANEIHGDFWANRIDEVTAAERLAQCLDVSADDGRYIALDESPPLPVGAGPALGAFAAEIRATWVQLARLLDAWHSVADGAGIEMLLSRQYPFGSSLEEVLAATAAWEAEITAFQHGVNHDPATEALR